MSDYIRAISAELDRIGATYRFERGGKHPRVVIDHAGRSMFYVFPGTPGDSRRGILNALTDLRRLLGVSPPERPKSTRPAKQRAIRPDAAPTSFATRPDPFLALAAWRPPSRFTWVRTSGSTWRVEASGG